MLKPPKSGNESSCISGVGIVKEEVSLVMIGSVFVFGSTKENVRRWNNYNLYTGIFNYRVT